jgi:ribosomal protein S18 acetylase RimI-like enzyme
MWTLAHPSFDNDIIQLSLQLFAEDPSIHNVKPSQIVQTLKVYREQPVRGRTLVLTLQNHIAGYAFLSSFWSNELGGEICVVDEIFVLPCHRSQGWASRLISQLPKQRDLWPNKLVAIDLEVTPKNHRAFALYQNLGFKTLKNSHLRWFLAPTSI